jgi:hypothetical protein
MGTVRGKFRNTRRECGRNFLRVDPFLWEVRPKNEGLTEEDGR